MWANENFPGGSGTTSDISVLAFSHPLSGVRNQERRDFVVGNSFFQTVWVTSPSSTPLRDGLGPTYNATSCTACHFRDGRGRGLPEVSGRVDISLLFRLREKKEGFVARELENYGGQFNPHSIGGVQGEGTVVVDFESITGEFLDGEKYELKKPLYIFKDLKFGEFPSATIVSPRVGPQMIGLGLIENIKSEDILKNEDPYDIDGDGISGRANKVYSLLLRQKTLGRFGWKAGKSSLMEQNAAAFHGDIGITSTLHQEEDCPVIQIDCKKNMTIEDISDELLEKVTIYTQLLAVPVRRKLSELDEIDGKKVFNQLNCNVCHRETYQTGNNSRFDVLNQQAIYPYSDFLLHDMGDGLADDMGNFKIEEDATAREWRTPPLWGIGLIPTVNRHSRYLHDGRARDLNEAILWHGGEAQKSKENYLKLKKSERESLINFLNSL